MKPLAIDITNYRAYTSASVLLDSVSAAAIVGPNGVGKSTLPEAIVWALYGDSRSSAVDGVVRLGADEACVQFDYSHGGNIYRVIRKRSKGKKSDLQYLIQDSGEWKPLSGASIRETEERIARDLSMDANLFLASSCVMQGKSAGICEATPSERKSVLYRILEDRLSKFGPLHDSTKATVKGLDEAILLNRAKRRDLEVKIGLAESVQTSRSASANRLTEVQADLHSLEEQLEAAREAEAQRKADNDKLLSLRDQYNTLDSEFMQIDEKISEQAHIIADAQLILDNAERIRRDCVEADRLEAALQQHSKLHGEWLALNDAYNNKQCYHESEMHVLDSRISKIEAERDSLTEKIRQAKLRGQLLDEVPCAACAHSGTCQDECKLLAEARSAAAGIPAMETKLSDVQKRLDEVERQKADAIEDVNNALAEIDSRRCNVGYDQNTHKRDMGAYNNVRSARSELPQIEAAQVRVDVARKTMKELTIVKADKEQLRADVRRTAQELAASLSNTGSTESAARIAESIRTHREQIDQLNREIAVYDKQIEEINEAELLVSDIDAGIAEQERKRVIYSTLQNAFSRDGIPALIIDAAVPHIEEQANEVLSTLSDGRMSLKFITQKLKSSGGIAETLDIIVADSQGERPYEDWSGGEKLRIDLAVRVALGRLLAQRTGSSVRTLILDEVCAPLDEAGEEALIDCIQRLTESFNCIMLITHRDSLKDRLPQQILVSKNGHGSEIRLVA